MRLLLFLLLLPSVCAQKIAVSPSSLEFVGSRAEFTVINPNDHDLHFELAGSDVRLSRTSGLLFPGEKMSVFAERSGSSPIVVVKTSQDSDGLVLNPGIILRSERQSATDKPALENRTLYLKSSPVNPFPAIILVLGIVLCVCLLVKHRKFY